LVRNSQKKEKTHKRRWPIENEQKYYLEITKEEITKDFK
jgi:hypothetical protein